MKSNESTVEGYISSLPEDRQGAMIHLIEVIKKNLPPGFDEIMAYGMIGYVVPLSTYPAGYHCTPNTPLPFINLASQKNFIALYHMGLYGNPSLLEWFTTEFAKASKHKLDMGKSCIRFKKMDQIPYELIGQLCQKLNPEQWIECYQNAFLKK